MRLLMDTVRQYSLTGKQGQARLTRCLVTRRSSHGKSIAKMSGQESSPVQFSSFGRRSRRKRVNLPSRPATHRYTTNRSKTYWICLRGCCTVDGILQTASSLRISSLLTAATSMIWFQCWSRASRIEKVAHTSWIKTPAEAIRSSRSILSAKSHRETNQQRSTVRSVSWTWLEAKD